MNSLVFVLQHTFIFFCLPNLNATWVPHTRLSGKHSCDKLLEVFWVGGFFGLNMALLERFVPVMKSEREFQPETRGLRLFTAALERYVPKLTRTSILFQTSIADDSSQSRARDIQELGCLSLIPLKHAEDLHDDILLDFIQ
jgi:hypothetical protein